MPVEDALALAVAHHQGGRLAEAEGLYRQILAAAPDHARVLDLLGVIAAQTGREQEAVALLQRAIRVEPGLLSAHANLGRVYRQQHLLDDALRCQRQVLALDPHHAQAHNQVGELLTQRNAPGDADAALAAFEAAVRSSPEFPKAVLNLANAYAQRNAFARAVPLFERVVALKPDFLEGFTNLGNALAGLRRFPEAIACYDHVLRHKPDDVAATVNRAHALAGARRFADAAEAYEAALALDPSRGILHTQRGESLLELDRLEEALAAFRRGVERCPTDPAAHVALSAALKSAGRLDEAVAAADDALRVGPASISGRQNRAALLSSMGEVDAALAMLRDAAQLQSEDAPLWSAYVGMLHYSPTQTQASLCAAARDWGRRFADPLLPATLEFPNDRSPTRRLRVGYVSPDFHGHPVGFNVLPLIREHDRSAFEIICYAQEPNPDAVTAEFQRLADGWRDVHGRGDEEVAALIREDCVDILVDLALHTGGNRLLAFARKPAPVQVTFAGYPGTTGVRAIDYRLTDPYLDPPDGGDGCYAERSFRLPETFWCYDPLAHAFPVNELPARANGFVTFGCLNNFLKVNPGVIALWARVLRAVPRSRLVLLTGEGRHRDGTRAAFESLGVAGDRICFENYRPRIKYLELYRAIDIGLDTLPYNGHTTSLDSYWMGVPVITLVGSTVVGRAGLSQLTNLGLTELVANTPDDFERLATGLAGDLDRLAALRAGLRDRMRGSALIDGRRFARNIEFAYRSMWEGWCSSRG